MKQNLSAIRNSTEATGRAFGPRSKSANEREAVGDSKKMLTTDRAQNKDDQCLQPQKAPPQDTPAIEPPQEPSRGTRKDNTQKDKHTARGKAAEALWEELWWHKPLVDIPDMLTWTIPHTKTNSDNDDVSRRSARRLRLKDRSSRDALRHFVKLLSNDLVNRVKGGESPWVPFTPPLDSHYSILEFLGEGHYGKVRLCEEKETGTKFACKTVKKSSIGSIAVVEELCAEILVPLKLQEAAQGKKKQGRGCRGLVGLHEVVDDDAAVHLIMDHCDGGDLFDHIVTFGRLSEKHAAHVLRECVLAVMQMHSQGIIHRDLKPENILLSRPSEEAIRPPEDPASPCPPSVAFLPGVKVTDFGLCKEMKHGTPTTGAAGSLYYMAPEVVSREPYDQSIDVWSLGVVLYTCLSARLPFCGKDESSTYAAIVQAQPSFRKKPWSSVSYEAKTLVLQMLNPDPTKRITLEEVLSHAWINTHTETQSDVSRKPYSRLHCAQSFADRHQLSECMFSSF